MLRQSCYNNDDSERVFLCGKMLQNVVRGGETSKASEKGDGRCYFPCKKCFLRHPVRILIATAAKHCRKYGHINGGSNEYHPMVISYIFIIFFLFCQFYIKYIYIYIYIH
jgi:hypothetical protein